MKLLKNKKAEVHEGFSPLYFLLAGVIFIIMGFVLVMITGKYLSAFTAHDKDIPQHIYAYRAINVCLSYQDPITKRYYPGIIDD